MKKPKIKNRLLPVLLVCTVFIAVLLFVPINSNPDSPYSNISLVDRFIFDKKASDFSKQVVLVLGGDVMLGRTVMTTSLEKNDPTYPFAKVADFTRSADIAFVNLENPIFDGCQEDLTGVSLVFCAKPEMVKGLTFAGIDVANLANNHSLNYGQSGLDQTKGILIGNGIGYTGDGHLEIRKVNDTSFGFIGFEKAQQGDPELTDEERNLIMESNNKVDILVVSMHWGVEYEDEAREGVVKLAHELVDLGADVVVGHHPHWVQNVENYNGAPIYYSLGNLVFDQMGFEERRRGLLVKLTFNDKKITNEQLIKTYMENWAQPVLVEN